MKRNTVIAIAILCITAIEITALIVGLDGQLFLSSIGAITGLAGYLYGRRKDSN